MWLQQQVHLHSVETLQTAIGTGAVVSLRSVTSCFPKYTTTDLNSKVAVSVGHHTVGVKHGSYVGKHYSTGNFYWQLLQQHDCTDTWSANTDGEFLLTVSLSVIASCKVA